MQKTILVTGSTDGIGYETAKVLLKKGELVIIHGRNKGKAEEIREKLLSSLGKDISVETVAGDLSSLIQVREMAEELRKNFAQIDVLINNAGIFSPTLVVSRNGFELTFQVNYLSHFLLTLLLLDKIPDETGRIINVSSMAHSSQAPNFENFLGRGSYDPYLAYSDSKLANILFTYKLSRELSSRKITVNALHPGVIATKLLAAGWGVAFGGSVGKGAETSVFLATAESVRNVTGKYFVNKAESTSSAVSYDVPLQEKLWDFSLNAVSDFLNK